MDFVCSTVAMPRPFSRRQARQNARFLEALAHTGNARLAARLLGVHRATYTRRRARCLAFAARWDAALAAAHARFHRSGGARPPDSSVIASAAGARQSSAASGTRTKTLGGEPTIIRLASGKLQLRRALPGRITAGAEAAVLEILAETNNFRFAAAAVGFAHSSFLVRARRDPAFAREVEAARADARARIERAEPARAEAPVRDPGDRDRPPAITVTIAQALHALGAPPLKLPGTPFPARRCP